MGTHPVCSWRWPRAGTWSGRRFEECQYHLPPAGLHVSYNTKTSRHVYRPIRMIIAFVRGHFSIYVSQVTAIWIRNASILSTPTAKLSIVFLPNWHLRNCQEELAKNHFGNLIILILHSNKNVGIWHNGGVSENIWDPCWQNKWQWANFNRISYIVY